MQQRSGEGTAGDATRVGVLSRRQGGEQPRRRGQSEARLLIGSAVVGSAMCGQALRHSGRQMIGSKPVSPL